jgi:hypothetical protein
MALYSMGITENQLHDKQLAYLEWLCTPASERTPSSKKAYAAETGTYPTTLRAWEKLEHFRKAWQTKVDEVVGSPERTQNLLDRLYTAGMNGDTKSAQLYFQVTGKMAPQQVSVSRERVAVELTDAELDDLIATRASAEKKLRAV